MLRTVLALAIAGAIFASSSDVFAMGGGHKGRGGSGSSSSAASTSSSTSSGWQSGGEYSSYETGTVPEPGTIVLLASGAAGLIMWVRRRK